MTAAFTLQSIESRLKARAKGAIAAFFPVLFLFGLNAWICWRLFHTEYLDQMQSIEGAFLSLATYIERHWPRYDWFPEWYAGMPFVRTYQPVLHYTVALVSKALGLSPASAYHLIIATTYSLGAVTFYYLARALGGSRTMAFMAALMFSLFSPSTLLVRAIRVDAGGYLNARRLQALVFYGEGPNVTGLMLAMLALALLHRALEKRTPASLLLASVATAVVPALNWTSTVALLFGLAAYVAAGERREIQANLPRLFLFGAATTAFAFPFALPSTIRSTFLDAITLDDIPTPGPARWIAFALLILAVTLVRAMLIRRRAPFGARFAALYFVIAAWIVLTASWAGIRLTPKPARFHLAMEIPMILTIAFAMEKICRSRPRARRGALLLLAVLCLAQAVHYRKYARGLIRKADIATKVEYQEAEWLERNMNGARVFLSGSLSFWANVFTDTPQLTGCCVPSLTGAQPLIANYVVSAGYRNDAESADYALLWLKAYAVQAIAMGGPKSREYYKEFSYPDRFRGRLPLAWSSGDDYIYLVPERVPGLARAIHSRDEVRRAPQNGIDDGELRPFVRALDDPALPRASFEWTGANHATIGAVLDPDDVLSVAVSYDPGWKATANGRSIPVRPDGLGLIVLEPQCTGACQVCLSWSPGLEPRIAIALALLTLIAMTIWCVIARFGPRPARSA